jgi:CheY-like chemotaxis protein
MPRIILIDDDYASEVLAENLRHRGYDCRRINSAGAALGAIDEIARVDLVILDIIMARPVSQRSISGDASTGMEILAALRAKNSSLPVLIFSASTDPKIIDAILETPNTKYLSKWGTDFPDFIDRVRDCLGEQKKETQLKAFVVHGHDNVEKLALKNYLQNTLKFAEPIILHEQPNLGRTIIEKLEDYGAQIDFVFVLLTPDDKTAESGMTNDEKRRARQNVIFELGYFLGSFGRLSGRVVLLHKGLLELPNDIAGLIYIDISNGVETSGELIRREIAHAE